MLTINQNLKKKILAMKEDARNAGIQAQKQISDIEIQKIRNGYELKIINLETEIKMLEKTIDNLTKSEKDGIDKNRQADNKILKAQEIVLHVQKAIDNISDAASRSKNDMVNLRDRIEGEVKKIME